MNEVNFRDILDVATENIRCDEGVRIDFDQYDEYLTVCTIAYIQKGQVRIKSGYARRRKGEKRDLLVGRIESLIRAIR